MFDMELDGESPPSLSFESDVRMGPCPVQRLCKMYKRRAPAVVPLEPRLRQLGFRAGGP